MFRLSSRGKPTSTFINQWRRCSLVIILRKQALELGEKLTFFTFGFAGQEQQQRSLHDYYVDNDPHSFTM